jgi:hypothetical protein
LAVTLLSSCSLLAGEGEETPDALEPLDPAVSLTAAGVALAERAGLDETAPRYDVTGSVEPAEGEVRGTVEARLPVGADADSVTLRYFAGLPAFEADPTLGEVTVDGEAVDARRRSSVVDVPLPVGHGGDVVLSIDFAYTLPPSEAGSILDALGGMGGPADVGLLSRHEDAVNLGHWFPVWVPEGNSAEPDPGGFGDIGNFPAAVFRLELSVPEGWEVVDGGVRTEEQVSDGRRHVASEGYGMNDLAVTLLRGYERRSVDLDGALAGVTVTAHGPRDARDELDGVLQETSVALETLSEELVGYPWKEFDVVSAPLGAGVGGMEWPGATWIEPGLFAGGLPGLGGIEESLGGLLGGAGVEGLEGLDGLDGLLGGLGGETGRMIETMRAWTIAHEVGHEWWHVVVGNDSVLDPVVDEPLAQHSACLVLRRTHGAEADALCDAHVNSAFEQMRMMGAPDAAAARPTDAFASSTQYAGVVYGKAAAFYRALEDELGRDVVAGALATVARDNAFTMLSADGLRTQLARALGEDAPRFNRLWTRWMERSNGDADLDVDPSSGLGGLGPGDLGGLEGLLGEDPPDMAELEDLMGELLGQLEQPRPGGNG